ncbi:hypothetical protein SCT_2831 [Sulfuricella sp. T08]|uniref:hypothetical protein n=1 Tax=Sulfuricella sp. T08 TaxID=1632857 RepID=UPI0006179D23|nr:hypothetical protein [Sulfuricella sp. T08]GAO37409.1 hypothetical protein SCT_2831 [Sulfuricella sp. T08]
MSIFRSIFDFLTQPIGRDTDQAAIPSITHDDTNTIFDRHTNLGVNPSSGLPMLDDSMLDVGGNVFSCDNSPTTSFDDDWGSSFDSFDSGSGLSSND